MQTCGWPGFMGMNGYGTLKNDGTWMLTLEPRDQKLPHSTLPTALASVWPQGHFLSPVSTVEVHNWAHAHLILIFFNLYAIFNTADSSSLEFSSLSFSACTFLSLLPFQTFFCLFGILPNIAHLHSLQCFLLPLLSLHFQSHNRAPIADC